MDFSRTLLVALVAVLLEKVRTQYTGDPAFTAMWYTKEDFRNWPENDFGYLDLVATNTLPMIPFRSSSGHYPPTAHLIPSALSDRTDMFGIHVVAKCSPPVSGTYNISIGADDGFRFLSNGIVQSDPFQYRVHAFVIDVMEMTLSADEEYFWEIHYFEIAGSWGLEFKVEVDGVWEFVNSDWCTPTTLPPSTNFAGKAYRALDWTEPNSNENSCQGNDVDSATFLFHDVPVEGSDIYALLSRYKFGTECMIVRSASDYDTFIALKTHPIDLIPANRYCDMTGNTVLRTYGSLRVSGDWACKFRFLIETDLDPSLPDHAYKYTQHSGVHSIFFKEATFATLQNTSPFLESVQLRNYAAYKLPPGYALAPNNGLTKGAIIGSAFKFGGQCVVLADGTAVSTVSGLACNVDSGLDSTNIPGYYAVTGSDVADVFIKNPNGQEADAIESWDETSGNLVPVVGTHLVQSGGWAYGAVAGILPNFAGANACQERALKLPTGFTLVPPGDAGLLEVAKVYGFGSTCLVMSDGSGYTPVSGAACSTGIGQAVYNGNIYLATSTCPSIVMMRAPAPTHAPTLPPTFQPTFRPSNSPTHSPTLLPILQPTFEPSKSPSRSPTIAPSERPTALPTPQPSHSPSLNPTQMTTPNPTLMPTPNPTLMPTSEPSGKPSRRPTSALTSGPVEGPTSSDPSERSPSTDSSIIAGKNLLKNFSLRALMK